MLKEVTKKCPNCLEEHSMMVDKNKYNRWRAGEKVQMVWPEMTPAQREFLITGICSDECWNEYLGPEVD
jgi:hypothetical protein